MPSIHDWPNADPTASTGWLALYQTAGSGTPASNSYRLAVTKAMISKLSGVTPTTVTGASTILNSTSYVPVDTTSAGFALTLPVSPGDGDTVLFKDTTGACGTHALTLVGTVDGVSNPTIINVARGFYEIRWNAVHSVWEQIR